MVRKHSYTHMAIAHVRLRQSYLFVDVQFVAGDGIVDDSQAVDESLQILCSKLLILECASKELLAMVECVEVDIDLFQAVSVSSR